MQHNSHYLALCFVFHMQAYTISIVLKRSAYLSVFVRIELLLFGHAHLAIAHVRHTICTCTDKRHREQTKLGCLLIRCAVQSIVTTLIANITHSILTAHTVTRTSYVANPCVFVFHLSKLLLRLRPHRPIHRAHC